MSLNNVIENPEYKLLFLKAIKLGIMYGESNKSEFYKEKIDSEINSIMFPKNNESVKDESSKEDSSNVIIMNLENQKNIILRNIQNLSNNYSLNYTKINFLKNNLVSVMKEIEKHKEPPKPPAQIIRKNITEIRKKDIQQNENLTNELQDTLNKISSLIS